MSPETSWLLIVQDLLRLSCDNSMVRVAPNRLEEEDVVGHEEHRAVVARSACSSCSIASTSRWFVGSSRTRQLTPRAKRSARRARALAGESGAPRAQDDADRARTSQQRRASSSGSPLSATNVDEHHSSSATSRGAARAHRGPRPVRTSASLTRADAPEDRVEQGRVAAPFGPRSGLARRSRPRGRAVRA